MNADIAPGRAGKETLKVYIFDLLFTFAGWPQMRLEKCLLMYECPQRIFLISGSK